MRRGMKRSYRVLAQATCLFLLITTLWLWSGSISRSERIVRPNFPQQWKAAAESTTGQDRPSGSILGSNAPADAAAPGNGNSAIQGSITNSSTITSPPSVTHKPIAHDAGGTSTHSEPNSMFVPYVKAILDPDDTTLPRLECPAINATRYAHLRSADPGAAVVDPQTPLKYLFALNLRQAKAVLPRLLGSVLQAARFLGPTACMLSIVEGHSDDGTAAILAALRPELARLGLRYRLRSSPLDPAAGDRIQRLADLRNAALAPIMPPSATPDDDDGHDDAAADEHAAADAATTVLFLNDVAACADDVLELAHQRATLGAAMTCALDWTYVGRDPTFYDVWVARALAGGPFFDVPADGSWDSAWNLLSAPDDAAARHRLADARPFQVYACWNGAVAFTAAPLLGLLPPPERRASAPGPGGAGARVAFRASREGECFMGEPTLFCKDLWWAGYGRIAVVPSVNLEYSDEAAKKIKLLKGYTSDWTAKEDADANKIFWETNPPEKVKCMPSWGDQSWRLWNETLI